MHAAKLTIVFVLSSLVFHTSTATAEDLRYHNPVRPFANPAVAYEEPNGFVPVADPTKPLGVLEEVGVEEYSAARPTESAPSSRRNPARPAQPFELPQAADLIPAMTTHAPLASSDTLDTGPLSEAESALRSASTDTTVVMQSAPAVSIKTIGPTQFNLGKTASFVITIGNPGQSEVEDLELHANVPPGAELLVANPKPAETNDGSLRFVLGNLAPDSERHIQLVVKALRPGQIELVTRATFSSTAAAAVRVSQPKLEIACEAPELVDYGSPVEFSLTVANVGDGPASGVVLAAESSDPGAEAEETFEVGSLSPGESKELRLGAEALVAGMMESDFRVWDDSGLVAKTHSQVRVRRVILELVVTGPRANYLHRDGTYEIQVSNPGDTAAQEVAVISRLPDGLSVDVVDQPIDYDQEQRTVTWRFDELAVGATRILRLKARATEEGVQIQEIVATAKGAAEARLDHRTSVVARPSLSAMVSSPDGPLEIGKSANFQISLQNTGVKDAENLRVQVTLPVGLQAVAGDDYQLSEGGLVFSTRVLAAGEQQVLVFQASGRQAGDHVLRAILESDSLAHKLTVEGSVFVFDTTDGDYLTSAE